MVLVFLFLCCYEKLLLCSDSGESRRFRKMMLGVWPQKHSNCQRKSPCTLTTQQKTQQRLFCLHCIIHFPFFFKLSFLFPSSRRLERGRQGEGDSVQPGVFDQSGCVSWAAGRTTQPRYCRYTSRLTFVLSVSYRRSSKG